MGRWSGHWGNPGIINKMKIMPMSTLPLVLATENLKRSGPIRGPDGGVNHQQCRLVEEIDGEEVVLAEKSERWMKR